MRKGSKVTCCDVRCYRLFKSIWVHHYEEVGIGFNYGQDHITEFTHSLRSEMIIFHDIHLVLGPMSYTCKAHTLIARN